MNNLNDLVLYDYDYKNFDNLYDKGHGIIFNNEFDIFGTRYIISDFSNINHKFSKVEQKYLHSFEWMLHLKSVGTIEAKQKANLLLESWLDKYPIEDILGSKIVGNVDIVSQRIFNWIVCYKFLDVNGRLKEKYDICFNKQIKHLHNIHNKCAIQDKISLYKTLVIFCIYCEKHQTSLKYFLNLLVENIKINILHDGGHISRNPEASINSLHSLLIIYDFIKVSSSHSVNILRDNIDKLASFIRTLRHYNGSISVFNGGAESSRYKINFLLSLSNISSSPFFNLKNSNYIALKSNNATAIIDVGKNVENYDSFMAFELSFQDEKIITNLGNSKILRKNQENLIGRVNNSCLILKDKNGIITLPMCDKIKIEKRTEDDWEKVSISYYGLEEKYGISYHKTLYLSRGSMVCILGENLLNFSKGNHSKIQEAYIRMHLHPDIDNVEVYHHRKKILFPVGKDRYFFNSPDGKINLLQSFYHGREVSGEKCYTLDIPFNLESKSAKLEWSIFSIDSLYKLSDFKSL